ncbi:MAG: hypothetical protein ABF289_04780 [Clostridiales bacterium]
MEIINDKKVKNKFNNLLDQVQKKHLQPEDSFEVAAILESLGWNDDRAYNEFGVYNVFELSNQLWESIKTKINIIPHSTKENHSILKLSFDSFRNFIRGFIFALPMAISVISMLNLKFSLWSYENLTTDLATSIALSTILSFMTIGGFTQAIARRGFFFISQNYYTHAKKNTYLFLKIGYVLALIISILFFLLNSFFQYFTFKMVTTTIVFYFFMCSIWLAVTVMYILRKELIFTGLLIFGILMVYIQVRLFGYEQIIRSQIISLFIVSILSITIVILIFNKEEKKSDVTISSQKFKSSVAIYSTIPYFIYGFSYFTFLFADRIVAWSTNNLDYMPYLIWFRGRYELGLDFALLMLIIPMGFIEVIITNFVNELEVCQKDFNSTQIDLMYKKFKLSYIKRFIVVMIISIISATIVFFATDIFDKVFYTNNNSESLIHNPTTMFVFITALISYSILVLGLMNSLLLFTISQPHIVTKSLIYSLVINIILGFLLSRWMTAIIYNYNITNLPAGYSFSILGLLAGCITFLVLTFRSILKVLSKIDYYIYYMS